MIIIIIIIIIIISIIIDTIVVIVIIIIIIVFVIIIIINTIINIYISKNHPERIQTWEPRDTTDLTKGAAPGRLYLTRKVDMRLMDC